MVSPEIRGHCSAAHRCRSLARAGEISTQHHFWLGQSAIFLDPVFQTAKTIRVRDPAARCARVVHEPFAPKNMRAQGMPGARCTRSLARKKKTRTSIVTTVTPEITRHSPRNGFTVSFVLSPAIGLSCHRRLRIWRGKTRLGSHASANLTPASRRQNHTTSPYAKSAVRLRAIRQLTGLIDPPCHPLTSPDAAASTASRPALMTCATPLFRDGTVRISELIWVGSEAKYF
jgi:hypothetical protein